MRNYSKVEGKTVWDLEAELRKVFEDYSEYSDPQLGSGKFEDMVKLFASDDFYNLHLVAIKFLQFMQVK